MKHRRNKDTTPIFSGQKGKWQASHSLAEQVQDDFAPMRPSPVLPEVDALPDTKHQPTTTQRDRQLNRSQRRAHMRWHVVDALVAMPEQNIAVWHEPFKEPVKVTAHVRIRVLLNHKTGRGMTNEDGQEAGCKTGCCDPVLYRVGDVQQAATAGLEGQRGRKLAKHRNSIKHCGGALAAATGLPEVMSTLTR